ncbi:MAG: hypothetical protein DSY47_02575 [Hydrogenothermus sp.]|nr:MAG: hypothetical protein DSY47_02575 [Hydrogenothermus sp.]
MKKSKYLKSFLKNRIIENLNKLKNQDFVSEIDTQIFLVEPVLCLAGFDVFSPDIIKRANRNSKKLQGDIEVYNNEKLVLFIEVKNIKSDEFPRDLNGKGH